MFIRRFLDSKLQLLPVHNDQEGVEAMLTVANVCIGVIVAVMSTTCKLQLLPVHNDQEGVEATLTVAKVSIGVIVLVKSTSFSVC